ncbi:rab GTPase-activating protein 22-like [Phragmites australis]|uniref:rab GTPase-activating protein 22-like n=1 Tax=Phragmites australis TaxID=29695 RepID=UPI002D7840E7|nr:rab GTPase-activating protein 22-like [Phragmites australis]
MWAWGCVERVAAGLLGGAHGGGRWNTAVAVGVTAAAGLALVAIVVSSRRGGLKSPWWRRRRKAPLTSREWPGLFTPEGKLQDGGVKLLKKVRSGGIEPSIRAQVWLFLLGFYSLDSSEAERDAVKAQNRKGYLLLRKHCLRKSAYSIEESKQNSNETAVDNHEGGMNSNKGEESGVSSVESEEVPEKPSMEEHHTSEEGNPCFNTEQEVQNDTSETNPEQMNENHSSSSSSNEEDSETSDVTHEEASHKDVAAVCQSSVEDEQQILPRYSNTGGNMENDSELAEAACPVKSARTIEDFETWQRIIRLDAVRANDEWVSYSPSQAAVSREKAIESAKAVCLKDYEHLEPYRIHHASRLVAILEAYAIYDPEIGYCQGMSDLLAPLLAVLEEDDEAFWCFAGFMRKARHNFRLDEVGIRRQLNMVARIIKYKDFHLYRHLEMLEAADCFFVYRMVVVMFRRELTFEQTLCLWEVMWADQAANRAGIAKSSSWQKLWLGSPPTDDLVLYAIAASILQKRKLIIESYSSMDEIIRDCNSMAGQLDIWKLLDDAHDLVVTLHDMIE